MYSANSSVACLSTGLLHYARGPSANFYMPECCIGADELGADDVLDAGERDDQDARTGEVGHASARFSIHFL
jgi:hypothetical protein